MAEYEKKVREILRENGCSFLRRGKGDHDIDTALSQTGALQLIQR